MWEYVFDYQVNHSFCCDCFITGDKDSGFAAIVVGDG